MSIVIDNIDVYGFEAAIRGMRNPMNSWNKSDSKWIENNGFQYEVGKNDFKLMKSFATAGDDHGKYLRMITVSMHITAPFIGGKNF